MRDLRYALRILARSPGFTAAAVLSLALGIGVNTGIFSLINAMILHPLPCRDGDRVLLLSPYKERYSFYGAVSYPEFLDWKQQSRAFESLAATQEIILNLTGRGEVERLRGVRVSADFLSVFPAAPALGRMFTPREDAAGAERVLLVSYGFWQRRFGGRPDILGQALALDGNNYTIIGVMPAEFRFPSPESEFWTPLALEAATFTRGQRSFIVYGRLKPGIPPAGARAEMDTIARRLELAYPGTNAGWKIAAAPLGEILARGPRGALTVLMAAVAFVLLIACANLANLLLARAAGRAREIAIRTALGASRWHIVRQMLSESLLLSLAGGVLGLLLGRWGVQALLASLPRPMHPLGGTPFDLTMLAFTVSITLLTGLLFGLAPAVQASRPALNETLKESGRSSENRARGRGRAVLVVSEIAFALVLLLGAGMLIRGFALLLRESPGFRAGNLLTLQVPLSAARYGTPEQRGRFFRDLVERVERLPQVESVAAASGVPMGGGGALVSFLIEGRPAPPPGADVRSLARTVTPSYLRTMGIPLRAGRQFTEQDTDKAPLAAIINETMARRYWPAREGRVNPLGQRIRIDDRRPGETWLTIVGIAADSKNWMQSSEPFPEFCVPQRQNPILAMSLIVRAHAGDPARLTPAVRAEVRALDRDQPIANVRTMEQVVYESLTVPRTMSLLLGIFAAIALGLAVTGIFGVVSYAVSRRTHEIGVRMALGAAQRDVLRLVLRQGLALAGAGIAAGLLLSWPMMRLLSATLYGDVSTREPAIFAAASLLLGLVALAASYVPARRAARADPMAALRHE